METSDIAATSAFIAALLTRRRFASFADVLDHIQFHYTGHEIVAGFFRAQKTDDQAPIESSDDFLYLNSISFFIRNGNLELFDTPTNIPAAIADLDNNPNALKLEYKNIVFFCSKTLDDADAKQLVALLTSFYLASDVDGNQIEGAVRRLVRRTIEAPNTLIAISKAIASRFEVIAPYYLAINGQEGDLQLLARPSDALSRQLLEAKVVISDTSNSLKSGMSYSGRVILHDIKYYYKIVPVTYQDAELDGDSLVDNKEKVTKARPRMNLRRLAAIVLIDKQPVSILCYAYAKGLVDLYAGAPSHATITRIMTDVAELRAKAQLELLASPFIGVSAQNERVRIFSQTICSALVKVTSAHSATVRFFDPFDETLKPIASSFCKTLRENSSYAAPIPADPTTSLNACVFRNALPQGVYISDVREPLPPKLVKLGLQKLLTCRTETLSEICLPIVKAGLTIGVVNIESSCDYAFDRDEAFIRWMVRQLGEYIDLTARISDAGWMPRLSFMHFAAHRMERLRRKLSRHPEILQDIESAERRISIDYIDPAETETVITTDLMSKVRKFIEYPKENPSGLEVRGNIPERLPPRIAHSLEIILENLLQNALVHDGMQFPLCLEFNDSKDEASVPGSNLTISYSPEERFITLEDADGIGIAPRWNPVDASYHLGTFFAGVHVRLLGGMMWFSQERILGSAPFRYVIQIPINLN